MILKHRDMELLRFDWLEPEGVRVVSVKEENRRFLPTERLRILEDFLQKRIRMMIDFGNKADDYLDLSKRDVVVNSKNETDDVANRILENMRADPFVSSGELADLLGVTVRTVQRILARLREEGRITRVGSDKTGHWVVV